MSKYTLDFEYEFEFELIGIASALPGFKIAWHINKILDINLSRVSDHLIKIDRDITHGELSFDNKAVVERRYSRYQFDDVDKELSYELISYKCQGNPISMEIKGYDYLLKIESPSEMADEYVSILQNHSIFNLVKKLEVENLNLEFLTD